MHFQKMCRGSRPVLDVCAIRRAQPVFPQLSRVVCCTLRRLLLFALLVQKSYQDCPKAQFEQRICVQEKARHR